MQIRRVFRAESAQSSRMRPGLQSKVVRYGVVQRWDRSAELLKRSFRGLRSVLQQELLT